jgi:hypothetical protein
MSRVQSDPPQSHANIDLEAEDGHIDWSTWGRQSLHAAELPVWALVEWCSFSIQTRLQPRLCLLVGQLESLESETVSSGYASTYFRAVDWTAQRKLRQKSNPSSGRLFCSFCMSPKNIFFSRDHCVFSSWKRRRTESR